MKKIVFFLLTAFSMQAYGSGLYEGTAAAILNFSLDPEKNRQTIMKTMCEKSDALKTSTDCYKTPSGKYLYEYEQGVERNKWYNIAREERAIILRKEREQRAFEMEQGRHAAEQYRQNQTRCKFWRDQNDSPRRTEILENEC